MSNECKNCRWFSSSESRLVFVVVAVVSMLCFSTPAEAAAGKVAYKGAKELAELLFIGGGKAAAREGLEVVTKRTDDVLVGLATRFGDDVAEAGQRGMSKAGYESLEIFEKQLAKHGDEAATAARHFDRFGALDPRNLVRAYNDPIDYADVIRFGDDAAEAFAKHGSVTSSGARTIRSAIGIQSDEALKSGYRAFARLDTQGTSNLKALLDRPESLRVTGNFAEAQFSQTVRAQGRIREVLEVVAEYGQRGLTFVWQNKGALAVGTVLVTFLANPGAYIDGVLDLAIGSTQTRTTENPDGSITTTTGRPAGGGFIGLVSSITETPLRIIGLCGAIGIAALLVLYFLPRVFAASRKAKDAYSVSWGRAKTDAPDATGEKSIKA